MDVINLGQLGWLRRERSNYYNKVILLTLIRENHWVIGTYNGKRVLVYDLKLSNSTKTDVFPHFQSFFSSLGLNEYNYLKITLTSLLIQENDVNCGVYAIITGFFKVLGIRIPTETNTTAWRGILSRLIGL